MASSISTRAPCATCADKSIGIFKCEGCAKIFCRKHVNEHRDILSQQLDEIVIEHDVLQQTITEQNDPKQLHQSLLQQIDQWEKESILKIQQIANETRQQIESSISSQEEGKVSKELNDLADRLRKARIDDDYVETDLHQWTTTLETLKNDLTKTPPRLTICEDSTTLIGKLCITKTGQETKQNERFVESFGNVCIEKNGNVIRHIGSKNSNAFVRGICEYTSGQHHIRFNATGKGFNYYMSFGIISKSKSIPHDENDMKFSTYGWRTNDETLPIHNNRQRINSNFVDMKNMLTYEIELLIDCDNRKISYFNLQTKNTRELIVDIEICPFPWQFLFYLYAVDNAVQLHSSYQSQ